ncbi:hypothetical protein FOCC_FOCC002271 [Frankliniella occidentalis]|nr:hypothetical protein FOCC_FOCC002271 [Frankliniella occidentalis]
MMLTSPQSFLLPAGQPDPPHPLDDRGGADRNGGRLPHLPRRLHQRRQPQTRDRHAVYRRFLPTQPEREFALYSLLCVVSQYQEYKAGRGRAVDEDSFLRVNARL